MGAIEITTYREPSWGSRIEGTVRIRKDSQERYYVDNVSVLDARIGELYTMLTCADGKTHYVFTVFFRQVDKQATAD
jgi:hypothetical protein